MTPTLTLADELLALAGKATALTTDDLTEFFGGEWRVCSGNKNYAICRDGTVRRVTRTNSTFPGRIVKPRPDKYGYLRINMSANCKSRDHRLHVILLEAFVGPKPDGHEGAHWDGNLINNHLSNLRWATSKDNGADRVRHGTQHYDRILTLEQATAILLDMRPSKKIALQYGVSASAVQRIKNGRSWTHVLADARAALAAGEKT